MYEDPPTFTQILTKVANANLTKRERALFALGLITNGRISELINCRAASIKLYDLQGNEISTGIGNPKAPAGSFYKGLQPKDISRLLITLKNQKSKKTKLKAVPVINVGDFEIPIRWLLERLQELPDPIYMDDICGMNRFIAYRMFKNIDRNWFPHLMRHWGTSSDVRQGLDPEILRRKNGWIDLKMLSRYTHLRTADMVSAMERTYGKKPVPVVVAQE
jgi:hypothetical protein